MPAVSPIVHVRSAQVGIRERESRRGWGPTARGTGAAPLTHPWESSSCVLLTLRPSEPGASTQTKRTSFHVALELEHVESVDLRSEIRKAHAVLAAFACAGHSVATHVKIALRRAAGVVCCFYLGCNTSGADCPLGYRLERFGSPVPLL